MKYLPVLTRNRILLLFAPTSDRGVLFDLAARLALESALFVIDAGNTFQGYTLARTIKRYTMEYEPILQRITLSRVFTCYQTLALLCQCASGLQPGQNEPILVLDFLATFYDQGVIVADRRRLLEGCIEQLKKISQRSPVAIWVRRRDLVPPEGLEFQARLETAAGQVWQPEKHPIPLLKQPGLFNE